MRRTIKIPLKEPLITHAGPLKEIVLREPSYSEFLEVGDPYTVAGSPGGQAFIIENAEAIRSYIALCMVEPKDPALLEQSSAMVARDVKEGMLSFFRPGAEAGEASEISPTISSSAGSASGQAKSAS